MTQPVKLLERKSDFIFDLTWNDVFFHKEDQPHDYPHIRLTVPAVLEVLRKYKDEIRKEPQS